MHRALTVFCIIRAQCWTHEHRTWYARFLSITLTKAPCTFQEVLNFIRLGALWWWQGQSCLGEVGQCLSRRWSRKGNQPECVISSMKLLKRDNCRVILLGNIPGSCPLETPRSLLLSTYLEDLRVDLWLGWEESVSAVTSRSSVKDSEEFLQISESTFMCLLQEWIPLPALQHVS